MWLKKNVPRFYLLFLQLSCTAWYRTDPLTHRIRTRSRCRIGWQAEKIPFSANIFKTDPYELIKLKTPHLKWNKCYNFSAKNGHFVFRLPLNNPELRLNGNIRAHVIQRAVSHNVTFKSEDFIQLLHELSSVTRGRMVFGIQPCSTGWHNFLKGKAESDKKMMALGSLLNLCRTDCIPLAIPKTQTKIPSSLVFVNCRLTATKWRWAMNEKYNSLIKLYFYTYVDILYCGNSTCCHFHENVYTFF
jgi:hypothetical protein